jgi:hypothetical protein
LDAYWLDGRLPLGTLRRHAPNSYRSLNDRGAGLSAQARLHPAGPRSPQPGAPYTYVTTPAILSQFGFETLRDLPEFETLEDACLLSKDRLLAGDLMPSFPADADGEELGRSDDLTI